jgi:hypothetical protein
MGKGDTGSVAGTSLKTIGQESGVPSAATAIPLACKAREIGHGDGNGAAVSEIASQRFSKMPSTDAKAGVPCGQGV